MIGSIVSEIAASCFEFHSNRRIGEALKPGTSNDYRAKYDILPEANDQNKEMRVAREVSKRRSLIEAGTRYATDDSIMTLAVDKALLEYKKDPKQDLGALALKYIREVAPCYKHAGWGGKFKKWLFAQPVKPAYDSYGSGGAMRVSGVAKVAETLQEAEELAETVTKVTHNNESAICAAKAIAAATFMAKTGKSKQEIKEYIKKKYYPKLDNYIELDKSKAIGHREECWISAQQALGIFLNETSNSFENTVKNVMYVGGDADTIGAMLGGMLEEAYGVPEKYVKRAWGYLDARLRKILSDFWEKYPPKIIPENTNKPTYKIPDSLKMLVEQHKSNPQQNVLMPQKNDLKIVKAGFLQTTLQNANNAPTPLSAKNDPKCNKTGANVNKMNPNVSKMPSIQQKPQNISNVNNKNQININNMSSVNKINVSAQNQKFNLSGTVNDPKIKYNKITIQGEKESGRIKTATVQCGDKSFDCSNGFWILDTSKTPNYPRKVLVSKEDVRDFKVNGNQIEVILRQGAELIDSKDKCSYRASELKSGRFILLGSNTNTKEQMRDLKKKIIQKKNNRYYDLSVPKNQRRYSTMDCSQDKKITLYYSNDRISAMFMHYYKDGKYVESYDCRDCIIEGKFFDKYKLNRIAQSIDKAQANKKKISEKKTQVQTKQTVKEMFTKEQSEKLTLEEEHLRDILLHKQIREKKPELCWIWMDDKGVEQPDQNEINNMTDVQKKYYGKIKAFQKNREQYLREYQEMAKSLEQQIIQARGNANDKRGEDGLYPLQRKMMEEEKLEKLPNYMEPTKTEFENNWVKNDEMNISDALEMIEWLKDGKPGADLRKKDPKLQEKYDRAKAITIMNRIVRDIDEMTVFDNNIENEERLISTEQVKELLSLVTQAANRLPWNDVEIIRDAFDKWFNIYKDYAADTVDQMPAFIYRNVIQKARIELDRYKMGMEFALKWQENKQQHPALPQKPQAPINQFINNVPSVPLLPAAPGNNNQYVPGNQNISYALVKK